MKRNAERGKSREGIRSESVLPIILRGNKRGEKTVFLGGIQVVSMFAQNKPTGRRPSSFSAPRQTVLGMSRSDWSETSTGGSERPAGRSSVRSWRVRRPGRRCIDRMSTVKTPGGRFTMGSNVGRNDKEGLSEV